MIRKSGNRFSEKIMLKQREEIVMRFRLIASRSNLRRLSSVCRPVSTILSVVWLLAVSPMHAAHADGLRRATDAYASGDYIRAVNGLSPLALHGNARAQGLLGFMYENGFGVPQAYEAAANLYQKAAAQGDPFAQARLGLIYDKGHGVSQNVVLSYKWLDLAAAHAQKHQRDFYLRLRNAVASKMSPEQIVEGQRLALTWAPGRW
jgi:TPR repeat protein